jgi:hypothetical protein
MPAPMGERPIFVAARRGDGAFRTKRNLLGSEEMKQAALPVMRQGQGASPNVTRVSKHYVMSSSGFQIGDKSSLTLDTLALLRD